MGNSWGVEEAVCIDGMVGVDICAVEIAVGVETEGVDALLLLQLASQKVTHIT